MMWLRQSGIRRGHLLEIILFTLTFQGVHCQLTISPPGPTLVNAKVGSNVMLAVSFSGALDPVVRWFMGSLPVVTWTIGSSTPPDIPDDLKDVLRIEPNGSLTFVNVQLGYSNNYTLEITKSGLAPMEAFFILKVYESLQNVTLMTEPDYAREGHYTFTLWYSTLQGVAEQWRWYFNGEEIETNSHYSVKQKSLVINQPKRDDTGRYTLVLTNPFSKVTTHKDVTVLYGPDEPILGASPEQPFYVSGGSVILSCQAEGFPQPSAHWFFGSQNLSDSHGGVLNLTNVQTSQGGVYTCKVINDVTKQRNQKSMTVDVYERPLDSPVCWVHSANDNSAVQFHCRWPGGTPEAQLSFPVLTNTSSGAGDFSLTMTALQDLSGKMVICSADHPLQQNKCNITARSPMEFLPSVRTTVDLDGRIVVTIQCLSEASPRAVVSWSKGSEVLTNGTKYQINADTTQLSIRDFNISSSLLETYTCNCSNPLGSQIKNTLLLGPTISDSSLFSNHDGTVITFTWEVPPNSVVTGFDVQMKGPDLLSDSKNGSQVKEASKEFRSIQRKPGSVRSTDISILDPELTYRFRVIPNAGRTIGEPSEVHRIGPGEGLSGPAIAGIAAGIPCSLLFLLLLSGLIYLCVSRCRKKNRQTRYPLSRAVEKAVVTQPDATPHKLLTGGLKPPPDYDRLHYNQTPSEKSVALPTFVPPPPVRTATTV